MDKLKIETIVSGTSGNNNRREFIKKSILIGAFAGFGGITLFDSCKTQIEENSTVENLMREHALLSRLMLIYDHCNVQLVNNRAFDRESLTNAANVIKHYIEDYHEKAEEEYLFPYIVNANKLPELIQLLFIQHAEGRKLTLKIIQVTKQKPSLNTDESLKLSVLLTKFNSMYRPHAAREDTVVFPALRNSISNNKYLEMSENFKKKEQLLFGADGFDSMLEKVAVIEKKLGIYELADFNPIL
ncbi:MAG: hemerythrin domain-containing protein [Paludibacter sp.]